VGCAPEKTTRLSAPAPLLLMMGSIFALLSSGFVRGSVYPGESLQSQLRSMGSSAMLTSDKETK
jgi:hypothetical protein